jgi:hypothetical protein
MLLAPAIYFNLKWEELQLSTESDRLVKHLISLKILTQMKKYDPRKHYISCNTNGPNHKSTGTYNFESKSIWLKEIHRI